MRTCLWLAAAFAADDDEDTWDVDGVHGATHEVPFDLDEGTWVNVAVHGDTVVFDLLGDLWSVPLSGGDATRLTSGPAWDGQPAFSPDGTKLAFTSDRGGNENVWIADADGTDPRAFTEEEDARCTDPAWDPTGPWLVYRRRTVDTRSIGVTEIWQKHLEGGDGFALTKKDDHPHAAEPWVVGPYVWFSSRHGRFDYDENAVAGLWDVQRLDRRTGEIRPMARGAGSATRPTPSPDGRHLLFVSRERERTVLERLDLRTGRRATVADWLSPDEIEAFALHGTYPKPAWTGDGELVLWAKGKLWRIDPVSLERTEIPFRAQGSLTMRDVTRWPVEIPDEVEAKVIRWPTLSTRGAWALSALGQLWIRDAGGQLAKISEAGTGYAPAWSPDGTTLAWTSWSDRDGGALHLTGPDGKTATILTGGQLTNPAWSADGERIVLLRSPGGTIGPDLADVAFYDVVLLERDTRKEWSQHLVRTIDATEGSRKPRLHLHEGRVWHVEFRYEEPREPAIAVLVSTALDGTDLRTHLLLGEAEEVAISPDFTRVAYKLQHQLHVAALPPFARELELDALPHAQVTKIVGDWLAFSADGTEVTWAEGPTLKRLAVADLWKETPDDPDDADTDPLSEDPRIVSVPVGLTVPRHRPEGTLVLTGARVIPMTGGAVLDGVNVVIERDRIVEIGPGAVREGARVVDCAGKTVIPGLVDVHAHLHFSSGDVLPEQEWRYLTALDFGVTTVQDPSTVTDLVFTQKERVEAGLEKGPRVYSTGSVLYGARSSDNAETPSLDAARAHLRRLKAVGATSVKVYQQSQRERRQWYAQACNEEHVLCVPEGGGDSWMDLGMVVDGYHAIEHALPQTPLYADVRVLWAGSRGGAGDGLGTFYTPTLQVAYGGLMGKNWFQQHENPIDDARLRRHTPPRDLEAALWRVPVMAQEADWRFRSTAVDAARLRGEGVNVTLGAHGELQGLGVHWELWALAGPGAMSPMQALESATIGGARYVGLDRELGTVEVGKLADLVILDADPLADIRNSVRIAAVVKNGELFD